MGEKIPVSLKNYLDPKSDNFLGTGMNLQEFMLAGYLRTLTNSFPTLSGPAKKNRLRIIIELSAELKRIRDIDIFSCMLGEAAIEEVINGNTEDIQRLADLFRFTSECDEIKERYVPLWATFVGLLEMATVDGVEGH